MASATSICNVALSIIGVKPIQGLDQQNPNAAACNVLYEPTLRAMLSEFNWSFATEYVALALLADAPAVVWEYAYQRPENVINVQAVLSKDSVNSVEGFPFALGAGGKIYTDVADAYARVTTDEENPKNFPPYFQDLLSSKLAINLAGTLASPKSKLNTAMILYQNAAEAAMIADAGQGKEKEDADSLVQSRMGIMSNPFGV